MNKSLVGYGLGLIVGGIGGLLDVPLVAIIFGCIVFLWAYLVGG